MCGPRELALNYRRCGCHGGWWAGNSGWRGAARPAKPLRCQNTNSALGIVWTRAVNIQAPGGRLDSGCGRTAQQAQHEPAKTPAKLAPGGRGIGGKDAPRPYFRLVQQPWLMRSDRCLATNVRAILPSPRPVWFRPCVMGGIYGVHDHAARLKTFCC
jgi:hypothetical protein